MAQEPGEPVGLSTLITSATVEIFFGWGAVLEILKPHLQEKVHVYKGMKINVKIEARTDGLMVMVTPHDLEAKSELPKMFPVKDR